MCVRRTKYFHHTGYFTIGHKPFSGPSISTIPQLSVWPSAGWSMSSARNKKIARDWGRFVVFTLLGGVGHITTLGDYMVTIILKLLNTFRKIAEQ